MRIVIDLQGAQAASRHRGIGQFSLQFAQAIVRNGGNHEWFIALNAAFADTIEPIRAAFEGILSQERIAVWEAPGPVSGIDPSNRARCRTAERVREAFISSLRPDWLLVTSLFESHGFSNEAISSIGLHTPLPTAVVLYDLIPLIYPHIYLGDPVIEAWFLEKIDHLRRAKLLLSISKSSGHEAIEYLNFDPAAIAPIGTDCDARFQPISLSEKMRTHLRAAYGIERPFIMYTGGIDHRKNIEGLIRAYAALPKVLRHRHQLAVVCAIQAVERKRLLSLAYKVGLIEGELILTGFVSDEDLLALYNACTLFVFPSWHEGFGLPVLEAMRCGKAVLAANSSSLPEVVGREDALFNPFDEHAMTAMIERALTDDAFRHDLEQHALQQSQRFSWDETARRALAALEAAAPHATIAPPALIPAPRRRKLAYVSPLPPEKTGIADYSAELIPELTRWYEVEVVVDQHEVADPFIRANCPIRTVEEFSARASRYDRVLYHFGNPVFHEHMFQLLEEIPGVVVLHDFFLSSIQEYQDAHGFAPNAWERELLESHGYHAVREQFTVPDTAKVISRYPANLPVLQCALGVIVHSVYSRRLARQWYGDAAGADWTVIPLLRTPTLATNRKAARATLGLAEDDLLVCSFGLLAPTKLNHRLLEAWLASPLAMDTKAHLVFVGENHGGDYGQTLLRRIRESNAAERIRITGWADVETFRQYLAAADIGVQLRTLSRGETSGTVLDCMNYGLATIVNANGSFADLDPQGVWMLPDEFSDEELTEALTTLARDPERRRALGERAREIIRTRHAPRRCAEQYFEAIESIYQRAEAGLPGLLAGLVDQPLPQEEWPRIATSLARNFPPKPRRRQVLVDVSELVQRDAKSGIQRVVRAILREWLDNPPEGFQVEPVYATADAPGYRYARRWTSRFLGIPEEWAEDAPAEAWAGDLFVGLDLQPHVVPAQSTFLHDWHIRGIRVCFIVYDLLPVLLPQVLFPEGAQTAHQNWLTAISHFDAVVAISRTVADEMEEWLCTFGPQRERALSIGWFHLGADVHQSMPTTGLPQDAQKVLSQLISRATFLMVGTVEPRKGIAQTLGAFELLWAEGIDVNLVIVGKQGWLVEALIDKLSTHHEDGNRLFWLDGISDEFLEKVYAASTCLIAASYGEGFGLPLIEAAQHKLPIIARDISVFREVAGDHAFYFEDSRDPAVIAQAVRAWLALHHAGSAPSPQGLPWLTWKQSAECLLEILLGQAKPYKTWLPDPTGVMRLWGNDLRLHTQVGERYGRGMRTTEQSGFLVFGLYASLLAGSYRLTMYGTAARFTGGEWVDVVCKKGEQRLLHQALNGMSVGSWQFEDFFTLEFPVSDIEFRLWVEEGSELTLDRVTLMIDSAGKIT